MDTKTHDILLELKQGTEAQAVVWAEQSGSGYLPNYTDVVQSIEYANGHIVLTIGNAISGQASFSNEFKQEYPEFLKNVVASFAAKVAVYNADSARDCAVIYAPALPFTATTSMSNCFSSDSWLVEIQEYSIEADAPQSAIDSLSAFATINNASNTFSNCYNLKHIPSQWTFESVTKATEMFIRCSCLESLPSAIVMPHLTDARAMFNGCSVLTSLPSGMTFRQVTLASLIFADCIALEALPPNTSFDSVTTLNQSFRNCLSLQRFPNGMVFNLTNLSNIITTGAYNTNNINNALYHTFYNMGAATNSITNHFVVDAGVIENGGGIKFDLYLHQNGFQKLSPESVASLLHCLYDYATNDPTYANRIPSGCTNGGRSVPTAIVSSAMEDALYEVFDEVYQTDLDEYMESIGWEISFV